MFRKLMLVLLAGAICLSGIASALAGDLEFYNAKDYEKLSGKKLEYKEAPMLRTMVAAGELPPVEERLPEEPLVVKPLEEIGQYGGTLRRLNEHGNANYHMNFVYEFLVNYAPDTSYTYPNVLKTWKASEDAKTFTLYLRKGMRWSDGFPYTADDFMFWYEDVALNKELSPIPPSMLLSPTGKPGVWKKIDDYTIEISFDVPFGPFMENFTRWRPAPFLPKHYFKQFHPDYTPMDEIEKVMKKEGQPSWVALWNAKHGGWGQWHIDPDRPLISAWVPQNSVIDPVQVMARNPYYWKVDTEGNQLPYIDKITRLLSGNAEAMLLKTIAGEVDLQWSKFLGGLQNIPTIMENRERGNYRTVQTKVESNCRGAIAFNLSHKDPILREILLNKKFRIALSVALNREEMNKFVFRGFAIPSQPTVASGPPFYGEKLGKNYLQYDPDLANQLLDEIGLDKRDKNGYRLRSDGKRLRMVCIVSIRMPESMELAEEYRKYWEAIGIQVVNKPQPVGTLEALFLSGEYNMIMTSSMRTMGGRPMRPLIRMTESCLYSNIAPQWRTWIQSNGEKGDKPPDEDLEQIMKMVKIRKEAIGEPDEEKRIALTMKIFEILEENFWEIGGFTPPEKALVQVLVVNNRLGNVPGETINSEWLYSTPAQYYFKK